MNLQKKKRVFLFLEVVLIGLTIGGIFYGRYQTVQRTEGKKVEQEKETSIERESRKQSNFQNSYQNLQIQTS